MPQTSTYEETVDQPSEQTRLARAEFETIVASLRVPALERLITIGRLLLDDTRRMRPSSEQTRLARAEIETIVASLPVDELARLVRLGREILDETTTTEER